MKGRVTDAPAIVANGLVKRFGSTVAVDGLDLQVERGEIFGLLGHNGAGKTTTVRLLNGVLEPDEGQALVAGRDPAADGREVRRRCGVLPETTAVDLRMSGREHLLAFAALHGIPRPAAAARAGDLLATFDLTEAADQRAARYSKGMRQRLALARTLLHDPEVLFLDEPSAGLDPVSARDLHRLLLRAARERRRTVLVCTHNLDEAQRLCDRLAVLRNGRTVAAGTPGDLARRLSGGPRVEVEVAAGSGPKAVAAVVGLGLDADAGGDRITLHGLDRGRIPDVVAALVAEGVPVFGVGERAADLADVYLSLYGEPNAAEAGTA